MRPQISAQHPANDLTWGAEANLRDARPKASKGTLLRGNEVRLWYLRLVRDFDAILYSERISMLRILMRAWVTTAVAMVSSTTLTVTSPLRENFSRC